MHISPIRDEDTGAAGPALDCEGFFPPHYIRESWPVGPVASARRRWRWAIRARLWLRDGAALHVSKAIMLARMSRSTWFLGRSRRSWRVKVTR